jgi:hypothetical protein
MIRKIIFVLVVLILCTPLPRTIEKYFFEVNFESLLAGTFDVPDRPALSIKNIFNNSFQNYFEKYFNFNLVGRPTMTRIYNQILYSLFNSTCDAVVMGKYKSLFELTYLNAYLDEPADYKKDELFDKLVQLALLQQKVEEMGKLLFVIITPSKASIYPEYLPNVFTHYVSMKNRGEYAQNYYEYFVSNVSETGLKYFDFHEEFLELKNNGTDIFPKGGIHWTGPAVAAYFSELIKTMNKNIEENIGTIQTIKATPVWGKAFFVDNDLEQVLNLLPAYTNLPERVQKVFPFYKYLFPRAQFHSHHMESLSIPTEYRPSVFVCGGSFNWNWLCMVYGLWGWVNQDEDNHIFSSVEFSWYNSYVTKLPEFTRIADTTDDFSSILDKDIIIIEFNEQTMNPDSPQFVSAENLLEFIEKTRN